MDEREQAISVLTRDGGLPPSEEAIETVLYADRGELGQSYRALVEWPVLDAEPDIPLEGPEHDQWPLKHEDGSDVPEDETDGW